MSSNNNIVNNIGEQIKQLRQSKKISVEKLSELSGLISQSIRLRLKHLRELINFP